MKILILSLILLSPVLAKQLSAQDFLEIKYSVNDIKKQRDNFKNEKVKSVKFDNTIIEIDRAGKLINLNTIREYEYYQRYNYTDENLTSYNAPADMDTYFRYDARGNVKRKLMQLIQGYFTTMRMTVEFAKKLLLKRVKFVHLKI